MNSRASKLLPLAAALLLAATAQVALAGEPALQSKTFSQTFPLKAGETLRLANLAGSVELVPGKSGEVSVTVIAQAAGSGAADTQSLLDSLRWVETRDKKGRPEWALSYPVDRYRTYSYPRRGTGWWDDGETNMDYLGERVKVTGRQRAGAPVLFADLKIALPSSGPVAVRNGVGNVAGGSLAGELVVDTGSGDVDVKAFRGKLSVDTGSGDVALGDVEAECSVDTGSGDVRIASLRGNGTVDTGSGDVEIESATGGSLSADTGSGNVRVSGGEVAKLDVDTGSGDIQIDGVEMEILRADTGSGDVSIRSSLARTREILIDTGSGTVKIVGGADASFDLVADQGSGDIQVGYTDATYKKSGREIIGARRGDGRTRIVVETGSGDCIIQPGV